MKRSPECIPELPCVSTRGHDSHRCALWTAPIPPSHPVTKSRRVTRVTQESSRLRNAKRVSQILDYFG